MAEYEFECHTCKKIFTLFMRVSERRTARIQCPGPAGKGSWTKGPMSSLRKLNSSRTSSTSELGRPVRSNTKTWMLLRPARFGSTITCTSRSSPKGTVSS